MNGKTENEAYLTLAALCARAEHCQWEMLEKMRRWELSEEAQARVMARLVEERYVDDERYARAFVNDKVRYNKWGRRKVEQALWQKHIDEGVRQRVLDEVDDEAYLAVLRPLLQLRLRLHQPQHRQLQAWTFPIPIRICFVRPKLAVWWGFTFR